MNVIFSNISYTDVKEQRTKALSNFDTFDSLIEESFHFCFKRLPFLGIYLVYAYFFISKCLPIVTTTVFNFFNSISRDKLFTSFVLSCTVSCGVIVMALIFAYKVIFFAVKQVLPRKTPITDKEYKYKCFWRESENIEEALAIMDELNKLSTEDILYSEIIVEKDSDEITLFLKDSKWGLTIKQKYSVTHTSMMKKLRESGVLDFTFMDEEWSNLLQKYSLK